MEFELCIQTFQAIFNEIDLFTILSSSSTLLLLVPVVVVVMADVSIKTITAFSYDVRPPITRSCVRATWFQQFCDVSSLPHLSLGPSLQWYTIRQGASVESGDKKNCGHTGCSHWKHHFVCCLCG